MDRAVRSQANESAIDKDANLRKVSKQLRRIIELDDSPLTEERVPASRLLGCCRDFSTLLTAMLRHKGVPARARCGFATYFAPNHYEDHWVCQYWKSGDDRWVIVDAQLDSLQRGVLGPGSIQRISRKDFSFPRAGAGKCAVQARLIPRYSVLASGKVCGLSEAT